MLDGRVSIRTETARKGRPSAPRRPSNMVVLLIDDDRQHGSRFDHFAWRDFAGDGEGFALSEARLPQAFTSFGLLPNAVFALARSSAPQFQVNS